MYSKTVDAIANSADFLIRFLQMPRKTQDSVRDYLAPALKLALSVLDSCSVMEGHTVPEIAVTASLHRESVRSILKALENKVVVAEMEGTYKLWKLKRP